MINGSEVRAILQNNVKSCAAVPSSFLLPPKVRLFVWQGPQQLTKPYAVTGVLFFGLLRHLFPVLAACSAWQCRYRPVPDTEIVPCPDSGEGFHTLYSCNGQHLLNRYICTPSRGQVMTGVSTQSVSVCFFSRCSYIPVFH